MVTSERIPKVMAEKFAAITALTDAFCAQYLNEEYRQMIHRVVGALARKRPSPLSSGKESVWAAAAVHAVGRVNFLDDASQTPHCKPKAIYAFFGIAESTGQNKSKAIRDALKMGPFSHEWTLPTRVRQLRAQVLVFARAHFQKCHYSSANCSGAAGFSIPNA